MSGLIGMVVGLQSVGVLFVVLLVGMTLCLALRGPRTAKEQRKLQSDRHRLRREFWGYE
jgi:hypothetical protein